jgi:hypothetical protein
LNAGVKVILTLDPANYPLGFKDVLLAGDLPVVWTNTNYNMLYLNMGHGDKIFTDPNQNLLLQNAFLSYLSVRRTDLWKVNSSNRLQWTSPATSSATFAGDAMIEAIAEAVALKLERIVNASQRLMDIEEVWTCIEIFYASRAQLRQLGC